MLCTTKLLLPLVAKKFYCFRNWIGALALLVSGCAQITNPDGGPRDNVPPQLLNTIPENYTIHFQEKEIVLQFDEYVQLKDAQNSIVISPPQQQKPEFTLKGKKVFVKFNDTLYPNTTYVINFGKAIEDYNEANAATLPNYVFSTGKFIDSLQLKTQVKDALSNEVVKDALVMLYKNTQDSVPFRELPYYYGRTGDDGMATLDYLAAGDYKLFVLEEKNNNFLYDNKDEERIGWLSTLVRPNMVEKTKTDSVTSDSTAKPKSEARKLKSPVEDSLLIRIKLFAESKDKQVLKKWTWENAGKLNLIFNKPVDSFAYGVVSKLSPVWNSIEYNSSKDSITIWLADSLSDSAKVVFSDGKLFKDSVEFAYRKSKTDKAVSGGKGAKSAGNSAAFAVKYSSVNLKPKEAFRIEFPFPLNVADFTNTRIQQSSDSSTVKFTVRQDSVFSRYFYLEGDYVGGREYAFFAPAAAFEYFNGKWNDTLRTTFRVKESKELGNLKLKIAFADTQPQQVQLLDDKGKVIEERKLIPRKYMRFNALNPGNYKLRMITDVNQNGKWDTGNYLKNIAPEPSRTYEGFINIKANWDHDVEWKE